MQHTPELTTEALHTLRLTAERVARYAGEAILSYRAEGVRVADTKSSATDVVTEADRLAEELIVAELRVTRPDDGIFAEEGHSRPSTSGITWVVDPIDGTVNYLYNLPAYCVSIAATVADDGRYADGRRAVAAAVMNPRTGELFSAAEGAGAQRNGTLIGVGHTTQLSQALVATGFGYTAERRLEQVRMLTHVIPHIRDIRRIGSAAYDLCLVADGTLDAYFEIGIQPWDWAAGALIATEAGALTLGSGGYAPGSHMFIAGAPHLAKELHTLLESAQ